MVCSSVLACQLMCVCLLCRNALLMSNATAMVRVGGMGWLKPVAYCVVDVV